MVASGTCSSMEGCGLLKTISRGVRTTAGMYSPEWWDRARVRDLPVRSQTLAEVFHSFYLFTTKTFGISGPSRLEGFILCPDGSVEDLEDRFLRFRREKGHMENFVRINKGSPLWQHNTIPLASCIRRWYLYEFVQLVPLLLLVDLTEILVQRKEWGCSCDGCDKFVIVDNSSYWFFCRRCCGICSRIKQKLAELSGSAHKS